MDSELLRQLRALNPSSPGLTSSFERLCASGLHQLPLRRFRERPHSATSVLKNLVGHPREAWLLLRALRLQQVQVDVVHRNAALDVAAKAGAWRRSLEALWEAEADVVSFGSVASACAARGRWRNAEAVVTMARAALRANLITVNSLLHGCAKARRWLQAVSYCERLRHHSSVPNETSLSSVLSSCVGHWSLAQQLLRSSPSLYELNSVLNAYEKGSGWELASALLMAMPRLKVLVFDDFWMVSHGFYMDFLTSQWFSGGV